MIIMKGDANTENRVENKNTDDNKEQNGNTTTHAGETNGGLSEATSEDEIITDISQLNNEYNPAAAIAGAVAAAVSGHRKSIPDIPETIAE